MEKHLVALCGPWMKKMDDEGKHYQNFQVVKMGKIIMVRVCLISSPANTSRHLGLCIGILPMAGNHLLLFVLGLPITSIWHYLLGSFSCRC